MKSKIFKNHQIEFQISTFYHKQQHKRGQFKPVFFSAIWVYADFFLEICFEHSIYLLARRRRRSTLFYVYKSQIPLISALKIQFSEHFSRKSQIFSAYISLSSNLYAEKSAFKCEKKHWNLHLHHASTRFITSNFDLRR